MALPHAPPACPKCGRPMEAGYVLGIATRGAGTLAWHPGNEAPEKFLEKLRFQRESELLEPLPWLGWGPLLPGHRCATCRVVQFEYTEGPPAVGPEVPGDQGPGFN